MINYFKGLALFCALFSFTANAEHQIGGGFYNLSDGDISITGLSGVYSNQVNDNFAYDIAVSLGGSDDFEDVAFEVDYGLAAKLKAGVTSNNLFFYASAGYATFNLEAKAGGFTAEADGNGALLGIGVDISTSEKILLNLDYSRGFGDLEDSNLFLGTVKYKF
jgi:hypothetical protein